jgi:hypothetical protein
MGVGAGIRHGINRVLSMPGGLALSWKNMKDAKILDGNWMPVAVASRNLSIVRLFLYA